MSFEAPFKHPACSHDGLCCRVLPAVLIRVNLARFDGWERQAGDPLAMMLHVQFTALLEWLVRLQIQRRVQSRQSTNSETAKCEFRRKHIFDLLCKVWATKPSTVGRWKENCPHRHRALLLSSTGSNLEDWARVVTVRSGWWLVVHVQILEVSSTTDRSHQKSYLVRDTSNHCLLSSCRKDNIFLPLLRVATLGVSGW